MSLFDSIDGQYTRVTLKFFSKVKSSSYEESEERCAR